MRKIVPFVTILALLAFFAFFLFLPVYTVIEEGVKWELVKEVFRNAVYVEGLVNSLKIACVTTIFVFCIAFPLAIFTDSYEFPGKSICPALMMLPMILPPFVGALGFQQILGHYGVLNTLLVKMGFARIDFLGGEGIFWSVCAIEALHLYPILYLNLVTALGNLDPSLTESARNLGAGKWTILRKITLPMLKPGILAGGSLVLIWSFTELGTPLMFGYSRTTAVQIFNGITQITMNPIPYTLVTIMLCASLIMYGAARLLLKSQGNSGTGSTKGSLNAAAREAKGWKKLAIPGAFLVVTFLAVAPHIALVLTAFSRNWNGTILPENFTLLHFENALSHKYVVPGILNSLKYSSLAMLFALVIGILISLIVTRWRVRGGSILDFLAMTPLAIPGIVVAFGFLGMSVKYAWAHEFFNPVDNPLLLLAVAYAVRRLPYVVRAVTSGLEQIPEELENAARNLGEGPFGTFRKIVLPLIAANVMVGGLFAFSFSMLEVSDSLILAQKAQYFPITRTLLELSLILGSGPTTACAFGVWTMAFMAATLFAASLILGKKVGSIFRL